VATVEWQRVVLRHVKPFKKESANQASNKRTVLLDAAPASNVVIDLGLSSSDEASIDSNQLTFTPSNWDTPQTVTVTGIDDANSDGNQTTTLTLSVDDAASDDDYDPLADQQISITTIDTTGKRYLDVMGTRRICL